MKTETTQGLKKIPMAEYLAHPAESRSDLLRIVEHNPYYYRWHKLNKEEFKETDATRYGTAMHEAIFEPHLFQANWVPYGGSRTRSRGKDGELYPSGKYKAWLEETGNRDEQVLPIEDYTLIVESAKKIRSLPGPSYLLETGKAEQSVFWIDPDTELECKARFDFVDTERGLAVDLKTTADITPEAFAKSCANYGYAVQAVHYIDAMCALTEQPMVDWEADTDGPSFLFLAVSKELPIEVALYQIDRADMQKAARIRRTALRAIRECVDSGKWPGLPHQIQSLSLPKWWAPNVA